MPISTGCRARPNSPNSASRIWPTARGAVEWPDRAAGFLPPDRLDITFTLAPQFGPDVRNARVIGYGAFGTRVERIPQVRAFLDQAGYREVPRRRMVGDASTRIFERLDAGRPLRDPDECAAPAGRAAGARRQALQRDRASRRGHRSLCGAGAGPARPQPVGAGDPASRSRTRLPRHGRSRRRADRCRRSAGADRGALRGRASISCCRCTAANCRNGCRWRRARNIACRPTTWMRS